MTTGEGIFWGLAFVGLIWLYVATKDRWKWKRIMKWIGIVLLIPIVCLGVWAGWEKWVESQPRIELSLYEINVGQSMDDVIYKKGKPDKEEVNCPTGKTECAGEARWFYITDDITYIVSFEQSKVRWISAHLRDGKRYALPNFRGLSNYSGQAEVEELYGPPTKVSVSADKTRRLVSFVKYAVFFTFEKDEIISVGVMTPMGKPLSFIEEAPSQ